MIRATLPLSLMFYLVPILVLFTIWVPVINHYYVSNIVITDGMVETGRRLPHESVLYELKRFSFGLEPVWNNNNELIAAAVKILQGQVEIPGLPSTRISMPFNVDEIDRGLPGWQLNLAGFVIPKILLKAYEITGHDQFLETARDVILAWASYERTAWLPRGYLWNDHAIALRISVLAEFWRLYRDHPSYRPEVAKAIFQLVARSGQLLGRPAHFTFSTNHGVMQNLALWHLYVAFPSLPNVEEYKQLALNRLREQMAFFISGEGVVLEHSAGYHMGGLQNITMALRYLTLMGMPVPDDWKGQYLRARDFYAQLRRPDGSLPKFGDTGNGDLVGGPLDALVPDGSTDGRSEKTRQQRDWAPRQPHALYPVSAYSIWWDGLDEWPNIQQLSQTVVTWSYFPGHGHKHADEMSVLLWAGGETWWTSVGYWPYGVDGRAEAESWKASNAPHLVRESIYSVRNTRLLSYGWSADLAVIDLERTGPEKYVVRRQLIHIKPKLWIVIDSSSGSKTSRTTTAWTTSHRVNVSEGRILGSYELNVVNGNVALTVFIFGSGGMEAREVKGSVTPFIGWEVVDRNPTPASAIVVEQPANDSWAVALWLLKNGAGTTFEFTGKPYMGGWRSAENWKIVVPLVSGAVHVRREGNTVYVDGETLSGNVKEMELIEPSNVADEVMQIRTAYERAASKYPKVREVLEYRWKVSWVLVSIYVMQEVFFLVYRANKRKHWVALRVVNVFGWVGVGMWLVMVYFKS